MLTLLHEIENVKPGRVETKQAGLNRTEKNGYKRNTTSLYGTTRLSLQQASIFEWSRMTGGNYIHLLISLLQSKIRKIIQKQLIEFKSILEELKQKIGKIYSYRIYDSKYVASDIKKLFRSEEFDVLNCPTQLLSFNCMENLQSQIYRNNCQF